MISGNLKIAKNQLYIGEKSAVELIEKYGSPLYVLDEQKIRENCRTYANSIKKYFGESSMALYASKANSFKRIYSIVNQEGLGTDVVSSGEIFTAVKAGFPMENAYFHGNNKTDFDIEFAIDNGVGYFVADNREEILAIDHIAGKKGKIQKVLIRLTPGIDPHTYAAVATGKVDSKFGNAIVTGQAEEITKLALDKKNIELVGFHCHVGSQVFDSEVYFACAEIMLKFISQMQVKYGYKTQILDLGGGYGVRYVESDPVIDIEDNIRQVSELVKDLCKKFNIEVPAIRMEPGRSIVADAGVTLYTVGSVKQIPGFKNYVSIDGGMTDNPRYALYQSKYSVLLANKANEANDFKCTVAGRCCESGDLICEDVYLPKSVKRGDILCVLTTGAYNYAMSSNYNKIAKLPIVMVNGQEDYLAVKRESFEQLVQNDL